MTREEETHDYTWLVETRSKVQELLLRLYQFVISNRTKLENNQTQRGVFTLLTGAAFSLWRAVFLITDQQPFDPKEMLTHAESFLQRVVRDNIITYQQDHSTRAWTAGYYLNNACLRLETALGRLPEDARKDLPEAARFIQRVLQQSETVNKNLEFACDQAYETATWLYNCMLTLEN